MERDGLEVKLSHDLSCIELGNTSVFLLPVMMLTLQPQYWLQPSIMHEGLAFDNTG